jgi:hypothetical protein
VTDVVVPALTTVGALVVALVDACAVVHLISPFPGPIGPGPVGRSGITMGQ